MNNIVEFFSPAWNFFVHNLFSMAALTISVYTLWKGRKHLSFTFQKDISILPFKSIFCFDKDGNKLTYDICLMTSISIVNPSSSDIGYFDLRVFDTNTNINLNFLTSRTLPPDLDDKRVFYQATEGLRQLDIPTRNFGTFKSNSFSRMDIVIIIPDNLDTNSMDNLQDKKIQTLLKNQGVYNGLIAVGIIYSLFFTHSYYNSLLAIMIYIILVALYGSFSSGNKSIFFKQGTLAVIVAILLLIS